MVKKSNLLILCLSCFLVLSLAEVILRSYYLIKHGQSFFSNPNNLLTKYQARQLNPRRAFGTDHYDNASSPKIIKDRFEKSYPYQKEINTYRIVCLGGSTTENKINLEQSAIHYPLLLEQSLQHHYPNKKIEVINAGFAAYSTVQLIDLLAHDVIYWQPDLIIFSENINDLTAAYWPNFQSNYAHKYGTEFYTPPTYENLRTPLNIAFQHFRLYWLIKKRLTLLFPKTKDLPSSAPIIYQDSPPPLATQVFSDNLQTIASLATNNKIKVIFATQPISTDENKFHVPESAKAYHHIIIFPQHALFLKHHSYYNKLIEESAKQNNLYYLDQAELLKSQEDYFSDVVHYTDDGVKALAKNYSDYIIEIEIIPDR